ncbi:colicin E3-like toxin immunity protein [Pseudomonas sp.]|jgi:hypothetical protein|uniref:colicin E3-like toxin immunity protein n=1 Tax=Pseudomonas sp. TaxID=306 RepID=UPI003D6E7191
MSFRVTLEWFEKNSGFGVGEESSDIFENAHSVLNSLGLGGDYQIFDGAYDLKDQWKKILQPHFKHQISQENHDYQISFQYQGSRPY